jgi:hypothetical protein
VAPVSVTSRNVQSTKVQLTKLTIFAALRTRIIQIARSSLAPKVIFRFGHELKVNGGQKIDFMISIELKHQVLKACEWAL